ncbi:hypothetical protein [uncultured Bacteroides sp.]|uniref:hypothetical protein n=1 Tax=uncultured Bacteroides sp. TaxID=162156 RepID=UPI002AA73B9E|nr:hypothetical protein [uncultured Bacteroides sp.]
MSEKEYFICSKAVINVFPECEKSKPIKTGYEEDENIFVAVLDFDKVKLIYNSLDEIHQDDFWCQEIVGGTMNVAKIHLTNIRKNGIFKEIENILCLTNVNNRAMCIHQLCEKYGRNPIELANKF